MRRRILIITCAAVAAACAETPAGRKDLLGFLDKTPVSRESVHRELGDPSATFANCSVETFRLAENASGYYVAARASNAFRGIHEGEPYDLVVEYGDRGSVSGHSVAAVRPPFAPGAGRAPSNRATRVAPTVPSFIVPQRTTRAQVLSQLGAPDGIGRGESWYWYGSAYRAGFVARAYHDEDSLERWLRARQLPRLLVRFDARGVVESAAILAAACWEDPSQAACANTAAYAGQTEPASPVPPAGEVVATYENSAWMRLGTWVDGAQWCRSPEHDFRPKSGLTTGTLVVTRRALVLEATPASAAAAGPAQASPAAVAVPFAEVVGVAGYKQPEADPVIPIIGLLVLISEQAENARLGEWAQVRLRDHSCLFLKTPTGDTGAVGWRRMQTLLQPLVTEAAQACYAPSSSASKPSR